MQTSLTLVFVWYENKFIATRLVPLQNYFSLYIINYSPFTEVLSLLSLIMSIFYFICSIPTALFSWLHLTQISHAGLSLRSRKLVYPVHHFHHILKDKTDLCYHAAVLPPLVTYEPSNRFPWTWYDHHVTPAFNFFHQYGSHTNFLVVGDNTITQHMGLKCYDNRFLTSIKLFKNFCGTKQQYGSHVISIFSVQFEGNDLS
jgi:hypothetical protein